jgi:hypothetical protein
MPSRRLHNARAQCAPAIASTTTIWWWALCAAAALNAAAWAVSAHYFWRIRPRIDPGIVRTRDLLLWLSLVYVLGCAFRSLFPMLDVERLCLHDTPVSRIAVGRSVATVAELAFATQWMLLLKEAGAVRAARAVLPLIVLAEALSWLAAVSANDLYHAAEMSVWTLTAVLAVGFFASRWPHEGAAGRRVIAAALSISAGYVAFMAAYVVPMFFGRWQADLAAGWQPLPLQAGLAQIVGHCTVARDWARWQEDAVWLTLYFTTAVWMSIALSRVPSLKPSR